MKCYIKVLKKKKIMTTICKYFSISSSLHNMQTQIKKWSTQISKYWHCDFINFHWYQFSWICRKLEMFVEIWIEWFCYLLITSLITHAIHGFDFNEPHENWYSTNTNEFTVEQFFCFRKKIYLYLIGYNNNYKETLVNRLITCFSLKLYISFQQNTKPGILISIVHYITGKN